MIKTDDLTESRQRLIGKDVDFTGNEDFTAFVGRVVAVEEDTESSLYATVVDLDNEFFDINLSELALIEQ